MIASDLGGMSVRAQSAITSWIAGLRCLTKQDEWRRKSGETMAPRARKLDRWAGKPMMIFG